ncbi:MAG TPA: hypothetical protein VGF13_07430 [Verrucomicrobiae bacterium]|jgi:hypothetical protein
MQVHVPNLEDEVKTALRNVAGVCGGKCDREWTTAIKREFIRLGKEKRYQVCAGGFPGECEKEWLYDLVWYRNEPAEHLREVGLIMESEWSRVPAYVRYDFEKLLIAKSPVKVMVFSEYRKNLPELWAMLGKAIECFKTEPAQENYILAGWDSSRHEFEFRTIPA